MACRSARRRWLPRFRIAGTGRGGAGSNSGPWEKPAGGSKGPNAAAISSGDRSAPPGAASPDATCVLPSAWFMLAWTPALREGYDARPPPARARLAALRPRPNRACSAHGTAEDAVLFVVLLVVLLRPVEGGGGRDLAADGMAQAPVLFDPVLHRQGDALLLFAVIEDRRAVLRVTIDLLPAPAGGVVGGEEDLHQLFVRDPVRVELHLDRLRVAGASGADVAVG